MAITELRTKLWPEIVHRPFLETSPQTLGQVPRSLARPLVRDTLARQ